MADNKDEPRVTGIGGIFFKCEDPDKMREWYGKHMGMNTNQYGALFGFRDFNDKEHKGYLQWSTMSKNSKHFEPTTSDFMINYRVNDMEGILEKMRSGGAEQIGEVMEFDYGKFAHVVDPEGRKIELWEPNDDPFTEEYGDDVNA